MRVIGTKVIRLVVVLLIVTFFSFALVKLLGDPINQVIPFGTAHEKARLRHDLHLDAPLVTQYTTWLKNLFRGDFGNYYNPSPQPVADVLRDAVPVSLELMLYAQVLALVVAIPLGVVTAYRVGTRFDRITNALAFGLLALPNLVLALVLAIYVGARWKLLPTQSNVAPFPLSPFDNWRYMLMPTVSLAAAQIAVYMRLLRSDMIATLQEDFITTAKSKGISNTRILWRHALRPSSLTLLTAAGLNVGALIGGAVVVERIFNVPGMGTRLTEAILGHQYVAVQSYVALIAIFYVVVNFVVDALYSVLDPRIRHARAIA